MYFKKCSWCIGLYDEFKKKFKLRVIPKKGLVYTAHIDGFEYKVRGLMEKDDTLFDFHVTNLSPCPEEDEKLKRYYDKYKHAPKKGPYKADGWEEAYSHCFYEYLEKVKENLINL